MKVVKKLINYFTLGLKTISINRTFLTTISLISLILISIVVYRAINLRNKVDDIEKSIIEKMETKVKINYPTYSISNNSGAQFIEDCLKTPLKKNELTDELLNISKELEDLFNESNYNFSFKYKELYTGFTLSYNSKQPIYAASTIKAPEAIYIYEKAEKGNINLNDTIKYTTNYYNTGTGVLKNKRFNDNYKISKLVEYSIIYSDNAAHIMLNNKYKRENMYKYWSEQGTKTIFKENTPWGNISANDASIYMEKLYNYHTDNNKYSKQLLSYFDKSWKIISTPNNKLRIANKTGWSGSSLHDAALVFDENPYTLVILTQRGYTEYQSFFDEVSTLIYKFHKKYWNQKEKICKIN